jgi:hypothetical protein
MVVLVRHRFITDVGGMLTAVARFVSDDVGAVLLQVIWCQGLLGVLLSVAEYLARYNCTCLRGWGVVYLL